MVGDLTCDVHLFEDGHVSGVGSRRRLLEEPRKFRELMMRVRADLLAKT
jgi:hypothetical protein